MGAVAVGAVGAVAAGAVAVAAVAVAVEGGDVWFSTNLYTNLVCVCYNYPPLKGYLSSSN